MNIGRCCLLWVLVLAGFGASSSRAAGAAPAPVPLFVAEDQGVARPAEPVAGGIPFPQGAVFDPARIGVRDAAGRPLPVQAHQLGIGWPDGSLKWALVQFQADVPARQTARYELSVSPKAEPPVPAPGKIEVTERDDAVVVTTGPLRFEVSRRDCRLPNRLWLSDNGTFTDKDLVIREGARLELIADREHMTPEEFKATGRGPYTLATFGVADQGSTMWKSNDNTFVFTNLVWNRMDRGIDYSADLAGGANITVEEAGPLRAVLRIEKAGEKKEGRVGFVARLYAYAGKTALRVELTVENYERVIPIPTQPYTVAILNAKHIRRLTYRLKPALGAIDRVEYGTDGGAQTAPTGGSVRVSQLAINRWSLADGAGATLAEGQHSPGWLSIGSGPRNATLAAKYFWEVHPKAVAFDAATGELALELRPPDGPGPGYPLVAGHVRTYDFVLAFNTPGTAAGAMARAELRPYPAPEYVTDTRATLGRFVPLDDPRFSSYRRYVENTVAREPARRLYGDLEFGDQISHVPHWRWNGYHGVSHEWFMFYLASALPSHFRFAESVVWHTMDVDTQHWGDDAGGRESEFARPENHTTACPNNGSIKVWNLGEVDYYLLTGKRRVLETLCKTAAYLTDVGGMAPGSLTDQRTTSLPLIHLSAMFQALGDERALSERYPVSYPPGVSHPHRNDSVGLEKSRVMLARLHDATHHQVGLLETGRIQEKALFIGFAADGFYRYWLLSRDPRAVTGIVAAATLLYKGDMVLPTGMPRYSLIPTVDGPWAVFQPHWDEVDQPATRAYQVTGDRKYLDWGKAPMDTLLNYKRIANRFTGLGSTVPEYLACLREAGLTQDDLARMRSDRDYDKALAELKPIAEAKYAITPSGESRAYCMLAEEVGRVLINLGRRDEAVAWLEHWEKNSQAYDVHPFLEHARALPESRKPAPP